MTPVARLVTFVDLRDDDDDGPDAPRMSVSARHDAELTDGRCVTLLSGRGWSGQLGYQLLDDDPPGQEVRGIWSYETVRGLEEDARRVVGPDEPRDGETWSEAEASHWEALTCVLRQAGVEVDAADLPALPHDVELSDRVLARLGGA